MVIGGDGDADVRTDGQTDRWTVGWMDGWMDGGTNRWMDRWTDGQMDRQKDIWKFTPVPYRTSALWGRCPKRTKKKKRGGFDTF